MTPKEKAKELFDKYYSNIPETGLQGKYSIFTQHAKQCALIAVDECLHTCVESMIYFWKEVKEEINNL